MKGQAKRILESVTELLGYDFEVVKGRLDAGYRKPRVISQDKGTVASGAQAHQDLLAGSVRLHVPHHAVKEDDDGQWMIEELARHGYRLSAGMLYPMLQSIKGWGYLTSVQVQVERTHRRVYRARALGQEALAAAEIKLRELCREVVQER